MGFRPLLGTLAPWFSDSQQARIMRLPASKSSRGMSGGAGAAVTLIAGRPVHPLDDVGDAADHNGACPYAGKRLTHQCNVAALARIAGNGVRTIIVETANRFARDLMVQEVGFAMLRSLGVTLVAADSPSSFLDDGPTSNLIRQILGAVS